MDRSYASAYEATQSTTKIPARMQMVDIGSKLARGRKRASQKTWVALRANTPDRTEGRKGTDGGYTPPGNEDAKECAQRGEHIHNQRVAGDLRRLMCCAPATPCASQALADSRKHVTYMKQGMLTFASQGKSVV